MNELIRQHRALVVACGIFRCRHRLSSCGVWAPTAWPQWLQLRAWLLCHIWGSLTRNQTCVPCPARRTLNHWTTREAPLVKLLNASESCKMTEDLPGRSNPSTPWAKDSCVRDWGPTPGLSELALQFGTLFNQRGLESLSIKLGWS